MTSLANKLKSIYTSDDKKTVLELLEALIKEVEKYEPSKGFLLHINCSSSSDGCNVAFNLHVNKPKNIETMSDLVSLVNENDMHDETLEATGMWYNTTQGACVVSHVMFEGSGFDVMGSKVSNGDNVSSNSTTLQIDTFSLSYEEI